mmetsp:Transcript_4185/g.12579  ORF Transcript_4185/g.12579 Transcript_4185/m.12579 type:complete len:183 (+) Transcript_4185:1907-2455(+)
MRLLCKASLADVALMSFLPLMNDSDVPPQVTPSSKTRPALAGVSVQLLYLHARGGAGVGRKTARASTQARVLGEKTPKIWGRDAMSTRCFGKVSQQINQSTCRATLAPIGGSIRVAPLLTERPLTPERVGTSELRLDGSAFMLSRCKNNALSVDQLSGWMLSSISLWTGMAEDFLNPFFVAP